MLSAAIRVPVFFLLLSFFSNTFAGQKSSEPDSLDLLGKIFEAEHNFYRLGSKGSIPRLAGESKGPDVKHTEIEVRLRMDEGLIEGRAGLCVEYLSSFSGELELNLGGRGMSVSSVRSSRGDSLGFGYSRENAVLKIYYAAEARPGGDTLWIDYGGELYLPLQPDSVVPGATENNRQLGQVITAEYAYSIAGCWYPAVPLESRIMQSFDVSITMPQGFTALASGDSTGMWLNADSSTTYTFSTKAYGRTTCSVSFFAARYQKFSIHDEECDITIYTTSDNQKKIESILYYSTVILKYYRDLYGGAPYPWKKLNIVECGRERLDLGVADLATVFLPQEFFLTSGESLQPSDISFLAHEIAHQWWGGLVRPDPAESRWLAEGFASFSALYVVGELKAEYGWEIADFWANYSIIVRNWLTAYPELNVPVSSLEAGYIVVYYKGAWIIKMLEYLLGEESFKNTINSFLLERKNGFITLEDFSNYWSSHFPDKNLQTFFQQWLFGAGYPVYRVRSRSIPDAEGYFLEVRIIQEKSFDLPLDIAFYYKDSSMERHSERINDINSLFSYKVEALPDSVRIDPDRFILADVFYVPNINLTQHPNTMLVDEPCRIDVMLDSLYPLQKATFFWRVDEGNYQAMELKVERGLDSVLIPAQHHSAKISYYLEVIDSLSQVVTCPVGAPDSTLQFYLTSAEDRPAEVAWISLDKTHPQSMFSHREDIVLYDLEKKRPLHTYEGLGGNVLGLSPNNRFLASASIKIRNEMLVIDLVEHRVTGRMVVPEEWGGQKIQITDDGSTVFMLAGQSSDTLIYGPVYIYRLNMGEGVYELIHEEDYRSKRIIDFKLNPVNMSLYIELVDFFGRHRMYVYNIQKRAIVDTLFFSNGYPQSFEFSGDYSRSLETRRDLVQGTYVLQERNLLTNTLYEKARISAEELKDNHNAKTMPVLITGKEIAAFVDIEANPLVAHILDFNKVIHRSINLVRWEISPSVFKIHATPSGKYLVVPYISFPLSEGKEKILMTIVETESTALPGNVCSSDQEISKLQCATVENRPYSQIEPGDIDGNSRVDIFDLIGMLKILSGSKKDFGFAADVDLNGRFDIFDLLGILKLLGG